MNLTDRALLAELEMLDADLRRAGADVDNSLAAGRTPTEVAAKLSVAGLAPTPSAVTWFSWHDGHTALATSDLGVPFWWPMSLDHALRDRERFDLGDEPWQWRPEWLPIAWFGGIPRLGLNCGAEPRDPEVRYLATDEGLFSDTERPRYGSLLELVVLWRKAIADGVVRRSDAGRWGVEKDQGAAAWRASLM